MALLTGVRRAMTGTGTVTGPMIGTGIETGTGTGAGTETGIEKGTATGIETGTELGSRSGIDATIAAAISTLSRSSTTTRVMRSRVGAQAAAAGQAGGMPSQGNSRRPPAAASGAHLLMPPEVGWQGCPQGGRPVPLCGAAQPHPLLQPICHGRGSCRQRWCCPLPLHLPRHLPLPQALLGCPHQPLMGTLEWRAHPCPRPHPRRHPRLGSR
jgi:hypothetical protein